MNKANTVLRVPVELLSEGALLAGNTIQGFNGICFVWFSEVVHFEEW